MKITEILSNFSPDAAASIDALGQTFLSTIQQSSDGPEVPTDLVAERRSRLLHFADRCSDAVHGRALDSDLRGQLSELSNQIAHEKQTGAEWWRASLNRFADRVDDGKILDGEARATLRAEFPEPKMEQIYETGTASAQPVFLEVEVVAIYW